MAKIGLAQEAGEPEVLSAGAGDCLTAADLFIDTVAKISCSAARRVI